MFHSVDIAKINVWLRHRRNWNQYKIPKESRLSLLKFTISIELKLQTIQITKPVGGLLRSSLEGETRKRKYPIVNPVLDVQYDKIENWPKFWEAKNKCRHCKISAGSVYCNKCNLHLCLSSIRNFFIIFSRNKQHLLLYFSNFLISMTLFWENFGFLWLVWKKKFKSDRQCVF